MVSIKTINFKQTGICIQVYWKWHKPLNKTNSIENPIDKNETR
jgi:hypothetical protein